MRYVIALAAALLLNAMANLMMKFGVRRFGQTGLDPQEGYMSLVSEVLRNWVLLGGLLLFAGNVVLYTYALHRIKISAAYPVMVGGGFAIIAVVAWKILDEHLSPGQWVGVGLVLAGVYLIAREMIVTQVP
ncbi:MAG: EamA family transporter [Phycisphaerales bacterium]|nr:EamA family transporter [Phycisphaerales bacterium]